jgi:hypothetical protein
VSFSNIFNRCQQVPEQKRNQNPLHPFHYIVRQIITVSKQVAGNEKEQAHQQYKVNFISNLPTVFKKNTDIDNAITNVMNDPTLYPDEKEKIIEGLRSKKSTEQLAAESSQSSIASHSGKKTTEALDERDQAAKYQKMYLENKILTPKQEQIRSKYYGAQ